MPAAHIAGAQTIPGATYLVPPTVERPGRHDESPQWRPLPAPSLQYHAAAYDTRRHRVIAFGGSTEFPSDYAIEELTNRTWALTLDESQAWSEIVPRGPAPSPRRGHTAVYDPVRDRLLVFGGGAAALGDPPYLSDVWALSLSGEPMWTRLEIAGALPPPRSGHCAIYDPIHDAMIVFGSSGGGGYEAPLNDTWSLSLSGTPSWRELELAGPMPPALSAGSTPYGAVFDSKRRRMVAIGRNISGGLDAWALSLTGLTTWSRLSPSGAPPPTRVDHSCAYDPDRDRVIVFGGYTPGIQVNDTWELSLSGVPSWAKLEPFGAPPSARMGAVAMYEHRKHRMLLVGGAGSVQQGTDTWALALKGRLQWSPLIDVARLPAGRQGHTAIYDSERERMVIFGGDSYEFSRSCLDAWALSLTGDRKWIALQPTTAWMHPNAGRGHSAIYDPVRQRMLVFGGITDPQEHDGVPKVLNELWSLSLAGEPIWSKIDAAGEVPPPLLGHLAIYDPGGDRMVVFGGWDGVTTREDVWALSLAQSPTWTNLTPTQPGPGPRGHARGVYDPLGKRMLLVGGSDGHQFHDDVWALSLAGRIGWSKVALPVSPPGNLVYDSKGERLVIWSGRSGWALGLSGPPVWKELTSANELPRAMDRNSAVYDPRGEQIVIFGGRYDMNDTWALSLDTGKERSEMVRELVVAASAPGPKLGPPQPNPSSGEAQVEFSLTKAGRVSLAVFDAAGRRVRSLAEGAFEPGKHSLTWDGRDAGGHPAPIGLYFMRLESGGQAITQKTVISR